MTQKIDSIAESLEKQIEIIIKATEDIRNDAIMDLSTMDSEVATICDKVDALADKDAQLLQGLMADMISRLEDLARELNAFQDRHGSELEEKDS